MFAGELSKACSKRRATAMPNLNQFDPAVVSNVELNSVAPNSKT